MIMDAKVTLPSDTEIVITRTFDAPREVVFAVWTTPEYVRRWWTSPDAPLIVCEIDLRVGGRWRYVSRNAAGVELGWYGSYLEIDPPRRLVSTEGFEGGSGAEAITELVLTENDARTTMIITVRCPTREHRDDLISSGTEVGLNRSLRRIDALLQPTPTKEYS
ncbi:MAG TPA: SRPBCC family protein [Microlunatus sp.]|nr:SRPBCC family protein [Microlunatus sp.]